MLALPRITKKNYFKQGFMCLLQAFFSTFLRKLSCEKNSIFALCAKTQSHFCPKTQGRGSFYLIKICEKTQKMGKKHRFSLKTQHRGSLRLLKPAPKPLKKKS